MKDSHISSSLIAFSFLHDKFTETGGDIRASVAPLFAPIRAKRAGQLFEPEKCAEDLAEYFDLKVHPYALESMAQTLKSCGVLVESGKTIIKAFRYAELPNDQLLAESGQFEQVVAEFVEYAQSRLKKVGVVEADDRIEDAFLERLVPMDFLDAVFKPGNSSSLFGAASPEGEADADQDFEAHMDFVCANFLLDLNSRPDSSSLDSLVVVCQGALLAELVLDLQQPTTAPDQLKGLNIIVDAPLMLDALGFHEDKNGEVARELFDKLKDAGAELVTLEHIFEEVSEVLRVTLDAYKKTRNPYGPMASKLRIDAAFRAYATATYNDLASAISELGIEVYIPDRVLYESAVARLPRNQEEEIYNALGPWRVEAKLRDARTLLDVLRLRDRVKKPKGKAIASAGFVFLTRNDVLARNAREVLLRRQLNSREMPPVAVTDRQMFGLLWMLSGGKNGGLTKKKLLANCVMATSANVDVINRAYEFLRNLDSNKANYFESLMQNKRAAHVLMEETLGDARIVTMQNVEEIYAEVEKVAGEKVAQEKDKEIGRLRDDFNARLNDMERTLRLQQEEQAQEAERKDSALVQSALQRGRWLRVAVETILILLVLYAVYLWLAPQAGLPGLPIWARSSLVLLVAMFLVLQWWRGKVPGKEDVRGIGRRIQLSVAQRFLNGLQREDLVVRLEGALEKREQETGDSMSENRGNKTGIACDTQL